MKHLKLFFALFAMLALGVGNAWGQTKIDVVSAIGFAGITTNEYTAAGTDHSAVANTTNNTSVTYAMQVFNGNTGAVRGNKSGNANFSCRNTTTCDGYYISNGLCEKCNINHCLKCSQDGNDCLECTDGFYIDSNEYVIDSYRFHKIFDMITINGYNSINDVLFLKGKNQTLLHILYHKNSTVPIFCI